MPKRTLYNATNQNLVGNEGSKNAQRRLKSPKNSNIVMAAQGQPNPMNAKQKKVTLKQLQIGNSIQSTDAVGGMT